MQKPITFQQEEFYPIVGASNYAISRNGRVLSIRRNLLLTPVLRNKYLRVRIDGRIFSIHRLVAIKFIPNPDNKPTVNHINGIKSDCRAENLEWATMKEQSEHAIAAGLFVPSRSEALINRKYGPASADTKAKMSAARSGEKHPKFKGYFVTPFGRFTSALQASKANGSVSHTEVRNRCKSELDKFKDWYFEPVCNTSK